MESGFGSKSDPKNQDKNPKDAPPSALRIYDQVVARTLSHGTTCASYFATVHVPATNALAALCHSRGQRAFIGRTCMDNPDFCPEYYRDQSADDSISATRSTIEYIHTLDPKGTLVKPIVTPRFVPTCTRPALEGLGKLVAEYNPPSAHPNAYFGEYKRSRPCQRPLPRMPELCLCLRYIQSSHTAHYPRTRRPPNSRRTCLGSQARC